MGGLTERWMASGIKRMFIPPSTPALGRTVLKCLWILCLRCFIGQIQEPRAVKCCEREEREDRGWRQCYCKSNLYWEQQTNSPPHSSPTLHHHWLMRWVLKVSKTVHLYVFAQFDCSLNLTFISLAKTRENYDPQRGLIQPTGQLSWNCFIIRYSSVAPNEHPQAFNMVRVARFPSTPKHLIRASNQQNLSNIWLNLPRNHEDVLSLTLSIVNGAIKQHVGDYRPP